MNVYKLKYNNKEEGINDFIDKSIYIEDFFDGESYIRYGDGVVSIVDIGKIESVPAIRDEEGEVILEPIYLDGYLFDIMTENAYDFGPNMVRPENPQHTWLNHDPNDYIK